MQADSIGWVGQTLANRYQVVKPLGEGGMAFVYMARDHNVEKDVVLKVPKAVLLADSEFAQRFDREIRSMVKLAHPHIIPIVDRGNHAGLPFYVMEYKSGGNLEDRFNVRPDGVRLPMPLASLSTWLRSIASALDFIHSQRFIHRDVKPSNILFDTHANAYLSDFGIVKAMGDDTNANAKMTLATQAGMVIGTGPYLAPEVINGEKYDGRADQYALAVTVYEALTGRLPYEGETLIAIAMKQSAGKITPIHERTPTVPKVLSRAVEQALGTDPNSRYSSCVEFAKAVFDASTSQPGSPEIARVHLACSQCGKRFVIPGSARTMPTRCPDCLWKSKAATATPEKASVSRAVPPPLPEQWPTAGDRKSSARGSKRSSPSSSTSEPMRALAEMPRKSSSLTPWLILGGVVFAAILAVTLYLLLGARGTIGDRQKSRDDLKSIIKG